MTEEQRDNLIKLIKSSAILNQSEREEWLVLLDLMDDKQAAELQKILQPPVNPEPKATPPPEDNKFMPVITPVIRPPQIPPRPTPSYNMPVITPKSTEKNINQQSGVPLSHIVNLPKDNKPSVSPGFSKFRDQLNQVLNEKELPEPAEDHELKLPAKTAQIQEHEKIISFPEKAPALTVAAVMPTPSPIKPLEPKPAPVPPPNIPKVPAQPAAPQSGLQNKDIFLKAAAYRQHSQSSLPKEPPAPIVKPQDIKKHPLSIKLDNVLDAAALNLGIWQSESHEALQQKLKDIISSQGYHQTIFNLEKSPLYKVYIDSGLQSLKASGNFGEGQGRYMNKQEFEQFTDLLREIQVN